MSKVRIFYHDTLVTLPVSAGSSRHHEDSVQALKLPRLGNETVNISTTAASTQPAPTGTRIAVVEVDQGVTVRWEATHPNAPGTVVATDDSPAMFGSQHLALGDGWILSFILAS